MRGRKDFTDDEVAEYVACGFSKAEAPRWARNLLPEVGTERALRLKALKWGPTALKEYLKSIGDGRGNPPALDVHHAEVLLNATPILGGPKIVLHWSAYLHYQYGWDLGEARAVELVLDCEAFRDRLTATTGYEIAWTVKRIIDGLLPHEREALISLTAEPGFSEIRRRSDDHTVALAKGVGSPGNLVVLKEHGFVIDERIHYGFGPLLERWRGFDAAAAPARERDQWLRGVATIWYWYWDWKGALPVQLGPGEDVPERLQLIFDDGIDPGRFRDAILSRGGWIEPNVLEGLVKEDIATAVSDGWL